MRACEKLSDYVIVLAYVFGKVKLLDEDHSLYYVHLLGKATLD